MQVTDKITITNEDNMELMARYSDKYFDLAIVDPPYGLGKKIYSGGTKGCKFHTLFGENKWDDEIPSEEYFEELFRVSKNQIVWGGNYFTDFLPVSGCWIFWDKINGNGSHFADGEFAWTNFKKSSKKFTCSVFNGLNGGKDRIHPTEKPVKLYNFILKTFAKTNDKILDTHLGSGSIAIACHDYGFELTACELDKEYYDKAIQRIKNHVSQQRLF
jgi:site-specific DNA-methyltransferase (adenine-specific)